MSLLGEQAYADYVLETGGPEDYWHENFDLGRLKTKKQFATSIKTDGIGVSVTVETPRGPESINPPARYHPF
jgi:hypothetical protein